MIYIAPSPSSLSLVSSPSARDFALCGEGFGAGLCRQRAGAAGEGAMGHQKAGSLPGEGVTASGALQEGNANVSKPSWEVGSHIAWVLGGAETGRGGFTEVETSWAALHPGGLEKQ